MGSLRSREIIGEDHAGFSTSYLLSIPSSVKRDAGSLVRVEEMIG